MTARASSRIAKGLRIPAALRVALHGESRDDICGFHIRRSLEIVLALANFGKFRRILRAQEGVGQLFQRDCCRRGETVLVSQFRNLLCTGDERRFSGSTVSAYRALESVYSWPK